MEPLQTLIVRFNGATLGEINRAIFAYPDAGLIEALTRTLGQARGDEILRKIAEELNIQLLSESELEVDESVFKENARELEQLIGLHKALPLGWAVSDEGKKLRLAMSNPLDQQTIDAFSSLYKLEVQVVLAQEQSISNVFSAYAAVLVLAVREALGVEPELPLADIARYVEDPEVRKAVQQVTATAVKHGAEKVVIDLNKMFLRAEFLFEHESSSSVEISVSTKAFLASMLRRGQISERSDASFEAVCRVDFKASAVNCLVVLHREVREANAVQQIEQRESLRAWRTLVLTDFSIERPDDPNFWMSITENCSLELRKLFKQRDGIIICVSRDSTARELALRAIAQSYPDLQAVDVAGKLVEQGELFAQSKESRVLVACDEESIITMLPVLASMPDLYKKQVRGVFSYYHIPRICECCAVPDELSTENQSIVSEYIQLDQSQFRKGSGCAVCLEKGYLGVVGACSVFDMASAVGRALLEGKTQEEIVQYLAQGGFGSLWENGITLVGAGKTSIESVGDILPRPHKEYEQMLGGTDSLKIKDSDLQEQVSLARSEVLDDEPLMPPEYVSGVPPEKPISGAAAFYSSAKEEALTEDFVDFSLEDIGKSRDFGLRRDPGGPPLLLIIDDDADQRAILRKVFELEGYQVEVAADGIDGIVSANRLQPELIILDFMMPDLDGRETCRRLKKSPGTAKIPVIALTAYPDPDVEYGLLKAGADDFCSKAISKKVLLKRIERLVNPE